MDKLLESVLNLNLPVVLVPTQRSQNGRDPVKKYPKKYDRDPDNNNNYDHDHDNNNNYDHDHHRRHRRHDRWPYYDPYWPYDDPYWPYDPYRPYDDPYDPYPYLYQKKENGNPKDAIKAGKNNFIITFTSTTDATTKIDDLNKKVGFKHKHKLSKALNGCTATVDNAFLSELFNDPDIQFIEKDSVVTDALYDKQEYKTAATTGLWNQTITNTVPVLTDNYSTVHCYILDTGIMATHSEFVPGQVILDYNTIAQTKNAADDNGHGTGVASVIGGKTVGSAVRTTLHAIKVLDSNGSGYTSNIIAGIDWVLSNKNTTNKVIINLSLGGSSSTSLNTAIQNAIINNCVIVCAAGNDGIDASSVSPANASGAITVSAYDSAKTKPTWSNFGPVVSSFAPGSSVKAAWNDTTSTFYSVSGTSFSCPIVAAIIARYLKTTPNASQMQIVSFITKSNVANEIVNPGVNTPNARIVWNPTNVVPC
jgi:hypothetical protein